MLLTALNAAVGYEAVAHRVAHHSKAPPVPDPDPCRLTETQRQAILNACTEPWLSQLVVVALLTGLRQGEELALSVQDVDFEGSRLWVRHTLTRTDGAYVLGEPKSSTSRRPVTLNEAALDALRKAIASRHVECPIPDLIFTTARGQPRNGSVLTHRFQAALAAASLPTLRWHDLRAAHGSWLLDTGTDIYTVSRRLGHRDVATTARFYGVVSEDLQRQASDRLV